MVIMEPVVDIYPLDIDIRYRHLDIDIRYRHLPISRTIQTKGLSGKSNFSRRRESVNTSKVI